MSENIEDRIRSWLETQGHRFELVVARAFARAGFSITVSEFSRDPETDTPREIDVVATHTSFLTRSNLFDLSFVIECKHSVEKPWVIFRTSNGLQPTVTDEFLYRFATEIGTVALLELSIGKQPGEVPLFALPQSMAHGVRRAFEKDTDLAYDAVTKACSGAAGLIAGAGTSLRSCMIAFPVVVIQGRLFECTIQETTEIELTEAPRATLLWRRPTAQTSRVPVELLTEACVEDYAKQKYQECEALRTTIENGLHKTKGMVVVSR